MRTIIKLFQTFCLKIIQSIKTFHRIISTFLFNIYLFVSNPKHFYKTYTIPKIKSLSTNLVYSIKNITIFSVFNWFKLIIKIITNLSAIFGFSVIIYFDTSLLFNIYENFLNWLRNFKLSNLYDYFYLLCNYIKISFKNIFNNISKYIREIIDSLLDKDKPIIVNNKEEISKDINEDLNIEDYKFDRKDYKTNAQKFLEDKNSTLTIDQAKMKDKNYSFIYSPYLY